ncbi:MJ0042-type zinc finger domain-containing protein [Brevundimonas sp.]|uniref:MJ0042-type zinc finger domain-containing protein n=1 Tax=Brevundimonas sp. TaxID=1871086 RepID=UPI002BC5B3DC|nr:MJ0042-type zinc finger domain-containing protein [Brevundimonas sp.]HWQ87593.1 MJ0042-type zinc finger domain-containing protein [Brevundimonas sp.]
MILTCPSCATSYFTPDEAIGPGGRTVRCKECKHTWRATLDEPLELSVSSNPAEAASFTARDEPETESLAETPAPELPRAFRARAEQQRRLRRAATHGVVWAGIASGFAALLASAWLFRVEVVEMAPRAAQAYAAVGLTVNPTGLDFEAITARPLPSDPGKVLVSGALRNVRDDERTAPPVRVALLDAQGAEIGHAVVRIDAAPVLPGKVQGFAAVIADPGARGQGIGVDFVLDAPSPRPEPRPAAPVRSDSRRAAPPPPAVHEPSSAPLHEAAVGGLRPALSPGDSAPMDMQPIDAVPVVDMHGVEAVSASNG